MRTRVINFRASPQLAVVLAQAAEREGATVSDIVRQAVEDRMARAAPASSELRAAFDPFGKLASSARGSLEAQRDMARNAVEMAYAFDPLTGEPLNDPVKVLIEGLVFARLAAAHGDIGDQGMVIAMLSKLAEHLGPDNAGDELAEMTARCFKACECPGVPASLADMLPKLARETSPEVLALAKEYASRLNDRVFSDAG